MTVHCDFHSSIIVVDGSVTTNNTSHTVFLRWFPQRLDMFCSKVRIRFLVRAGIDRNVDSRSAVRMIHRGRSGVPVKRFQ